MRRVWQVVTTVPLPDGDVFERRGRRFRRRRTAERHARSLDVAAWTYERLLTTSTVERARKQA